MFLGFFTETKSYRFNLNLGRKPLLKRLFSRGVVRPFIKTMKEVDKMGRVKSIRYSMKTELHNMESYGRSKKQDQDRMREAENNGKQILNADTTKYHIYSKNTMNNYQHEIDRFADFLESKDMKKLSLQDAEKEVQGYLDHLTNEKGLSAYSVHTACAALCKVFHTDMKDYDKEQRTISKLERGSKTYSEHLIEELEKDRIWCINRDYLGMRKNELLNLRARDIKEINGRVEIHYVGKDGKHNRQIYTVEYEKEFVLALKQDKKEEERIFDRQKVKQSKNLHKARELRCKAVYERVINDIDKRGKDAEKEYIDIIKGVFKDAKKPLRENLDNPYIVRGANRKRLLVEGRDVEYCRVASLFVSTTVSQHFRSNTTINHYISK